MDITPAQLRCFAAVAEHLHFGRAAEALHLSPSTVSENVATLERRAGRALLRRGRTVTLTPAGEQLRPIAQRALAALDDVNTWVSGTHTGETIRVGLMVSSRRFRTVLADATTAMPDVAWEVKHLGFDGSHRALADGDVDCAFITEVGESPADLHAVPLWSEGCVVVVRDDHTLARKHSLTRADLNGETLIAGRTPESSGRWLSTLLGDTAGLHVRPIAHNFDEILELCGVGAGLNIAGESAAEAYARPGLRFVPIDDLPRLTTYLCLPTSETPAAVARFVQVIAAAAKAVDP